MIDLFSINLFNPFKGYCSSGRCPNSFGNEFWNDFHEEIVWFICSQLRSLLTQRAFRSTLNIINILLTWGWVGEITWTLHSDGGQTRLSCCSLSEQIYQIFPERIRIRQPCKGNKLTQHGRKSIVGTNCRYETLNKSLAVTFFTAIVGDLAS